MQTAKKLLTWDTRLNIRALADEGFELAECKGNYFLKYGKEFIDLGNLKQTAKQFTSLFDKKNSTKAKKALEEWIERIRLRREALAKHLNKFDDSFFNHLSGDVSLIKVEFDNVWKSTEEWLYRGINGQGGHWLNEFIIVRNVLPPPVVSKVSDIPLDTPFRAIVDIKSLKGKLFPKLEPSSMFPRNWSYERIQQEVAWVYENTVARGEGQLQKLPHHKFNHFQSSSTSGFDILIEVDDLGNIMNAYPKI